jgi:ribosomal protein L40E
MRLLRQTPVQFFRRLVERFHAWRERRRAVRPFITPMYLNIPHYSVPIHREVTANGVRVYSLCADCGARLQASATLCDECALKRSPRPY